MKAGIAFASTAINFHATQEENNSLYRHSEFMENTSPKQVLLQLKLSLTVMVILLIAGTAAILWQQNRDKIASQTAGLISEINHDLRVSLEQQILGMSIAARTIAADTGMQQALCNRDADRLQTAWHSFFKGIHREKSLTHFNFLDTHRTCHAGRRIDSDTVIKIFIPSRSQSDSTRETSSEFCKNLYNHLDFAHLTR